jgi:FkbM family methyltransferase
LHGPAISGSVRRVTTPSIWRQRALDRARTTVSALTRRFGFDIARFDRGKLLAHHRISLVFDVGANVGQYASELRALGYAGRIVSCEPLRDEFERLARKAAKDPSWVALHCALGDTDGVTSINVAANSTSSSLLDMLPRHAEAAPHSAYTAVQQTNVFRLDSIFDEHCRAEDRVFLKLDVQGYERVVLAGAEKSLPRLQGVQLEMALVPLYRGEASHAELLAEMTSRGFQLMSIEPAFRDPSSGQLLAVDGVFFRDGGRS